MATPDKFYVLNALASEDSHSDRFDMDRLVHCEVVENTVKPHLFRDPETIQSACERVQALIVIAKVIDRRPKE